MSKDSTNSQSKEYCSTDYSSGNKNGKTTSDKPAVKEFCQPPVKVTVVERDITSKSIAKSKHSSPLIIKQNTLNSHQNSKNCKDKILHQNSCPTSKSSHPILSNLKNQKRVSD